MLLILLFPLFVINSRPGFTPYHCDLICFVRVTITLLRWMCFFLLDELHLGCYEEQKNKSSFYQPSQNGLSLYWCIEACGYEKFPLAAVFNDTNCHCVDDSVTLLIKNDSCNSSEEGKIFQVYNTSCFMVELVELYQELIFEQFPSKITPLLSSSTSSVKIGRAHV